MKKLDYATISIDGARQIAKVIQKAPETAKKVMKKLEAHPKGKVSIKKLQRHLSDTKNAHNDIL
jgi:hypothetical protein